MRAGARVVWDHPSQLGGRLVTLGLELEKNIDARMQPVAGEMEEYGRANAPWNDRTGNARAGLVALFQRSGKTATIIFGGSVFYQKFLELGTRFMAPRPIIRPTLEAFYPRIMGRFRGLLGGGG